ncbi:protein cereblon homolog isoform X3 [Drosophila navojoa]|uniref:protein cereblon homolog isoform X3 n=1 Tax=Drosophila navojoa TaxID=7232 RepID=UPI00084732D6|nr:protein cereblon homolog isoform X3 [Drosophila navojoa]
MDDEETGEIDENSSSSTNTNTNATATATETAGEMHVELGQGEEIPESSRNGAGTGAGDGIGAEAGAGAIPAEGAAHVSSRERLENMIEEVDNMFEEVSELMVDVTQLMRRANQLREDTGTGAVPQNPTLATNPTPPAEIEEEAEGPEQQAEYGLVNYDSPRRASISSRHSGSDMSLDSPVSEDDSDAEAVPRWMIPANRVRSAVDFLVLQRRNRDGDDISEVSPPPPLDVDMEEGVRFDTNLPAEHSYFGTNLNRVPGVDYLEVGSTHRMLIFMHEHVLFPGEVLPFMIDGSIIDEEIEDSGRDGVIFGVGFPLMQPRDDNPQKLYGVTCQIYEKGESGRQHVFYKSRALQRIVINCDDIQGRPQYIARNPTMKCYSKVKILPEYFLPEPLKCIDMGSLNRFRDIPSMQDKFRRFQLTTTPWPIEACGLYSFEHIVEKARQKLEIHKIDTMPKCPIQLSFWLLRNLHLTQTMHRMAFLTNSVNIRLQIIGSTLMEESLFYCRYCDSSLAYCSDLFAMSKHGVQTQYCNSAGYIHETNTVYRVIAHAIGYSGEPSTEFSWFPGYQWHIIICKFCAQHVGWEFKAVEPNLAPKVFFGLAGSSVRIGKFRERK